MSKKIAIIYYPESPILMKKLVDSALHNAENPDQVQFIFFIQPNNKECRDCAHKLYMEHSPDLFSDQEPTIKMVCSKEEGLWVQMCGRKKAETIEKIIYIAKDVTISKDYFKKNWDSNLIPNKAKSISE